MLSLCIIYGSHQILSCEIEKLSWHYENQVKYLLKSNFDKYLAFPFLSICLREEHPIPLMVRDRFRDAALSHVYFSFHQIMGKF